MRGAVIQARRTAARTAIALALLCAPGWVSPVEAACTFSSSGVAFGVYDVFAVAPADSTGTIVYRCTANEKDVTITLDQGANGTYAQRRLRSGAELLGYNLFLDAGRTTIWGNGTGGTSLYSIRNPPNRDVTLTIYGRIPAGQDVAVGTYTDTVLMVINF